MQTALPTLESSAYVHSPTALACAWRGPHWGTAPALLGDSVQGRARQQIITEVEVLLRVGYGS